ncbi:flippase-like domain-containing protein [Myxococcota bacterium]|nr:flippase-like domain-containing protein [Myxococcota bacterium]
MSDLPSPSPAPERGGRGRRSAVLGLVVGLVALALALWGVPLAEVGQALRNARWEWLLLVALVFQWQQLMRAWRQTVILRAVRPRSRYRTNLSVLCVSFLAINTVPGRVGEVVRPLLLLQREQLPLGVGFALVFVERVLDLCATFAMLGLVAFVFPPPTHVFTLGPVEIDWLALARGAAATVLPAVLLGLALLVFWGERLLGLLAPLSSRGPAAWRRLSRLGLSFAGTFVQGLQAVRSPARLAAVTALTVVTWAVSIWMYPMAAHAFGIGPLLGYGEGVAVLAVSMLGGIAPAPPGQAGTYEAFVRGGLALHGIVGPGPTPQGISPSLDAAAVALALTMHWWIMLVQAASALYFLVVDRLDLGDLVRQARQALRDP